MQVIPAIDLMKGNVVRLFQGDPKTVKIYSRLGDPVTVAKKWENDGAKTIHIIDLDAALNLGNNLEMIKDISKAVNLTIQVGGGIRTLESAENLLAMGINRVILGALAFNSPQILTLLQKKFTDDRLIVALDHQEGKIRVEGWKTPTQFGVEEAMMQFLNVNVDTFLITSITRDGTLAGPDLDTLGKACLHSEANIIAAGGVSKLNDLPSLKKIGVRGVVVGKALYEGAFTLKEAIKVVKED